MTRRLPNEVPVLKEQDGRHVGRERPTDVLWGAEAERPGLSSAPAAPVTVYWDDASGRTREVKRVCIRCIPDGRVPLLPMVVSPAGAAHEAERGDRTDCGKDCTGPDWWIRL